MSTFHTLLKRASSLLKIGGSETPTHKPADGEVIFCKNNVCVYPPSYLKSEVSHQPGYLTIREQTDEILRSTLILTWVPNAILEKNSRSLENRTPESSPCRSSFSSKCPSPSGRSPYHLPLSHSSLACSSSHKVGDVLHESTPESASKTPELDNADVQSISSTVSDMGSAREDYGSLESFSNSDDQTEMTASTNSHFISNDLDDLNNYKAVKRETQDEPQNMSVLETSITSTEGGVQSQSDSGIGPEEVAVALEKMICGLNDFESSKQETSSVDCPEKDSATENQDSCSVTSSEICFLNKSCEEPKNLEKKEKRSDLKLALTNNFNDDMNEKFHHKPTPEISISPLSPIASNSSSTTPTTSNRDPESFPSTPEETPPPSPKAEISKILFGEGTAESFVHAHNMDFPDDAFNSANKVSKRESFCGVFSVDLSQMRSLRLFYNDKECTCGQLVIANRESQYKILHFHRGGLDKLAKIFEDYKFLSNPKPTDSQSYQHFSVCRPEVSAAECHPEEGFYTIVDEQKWRCFMCEDGSIEDELQLRKEIFFAGLDIKLRKDVWPFLLHYYSFSSTFDQREQERNDKYIEYQAIRRKRDHMTPVEAELFWRNIQCTVEKDVVRTDRSHPFFAGDDNPNIEVMKNILLNYGFYNPKIGYTQGMSDLLAPILASVQDEAEAFWCFVGLMQRTIFVTCPKDFDMDINLNYLREIFRVLNKEFYKHLVAADALDLLFVHRWILLCFKREFPEAEAMKMWEACWAHYQTDYFHLFICSAIISIYGDDVVAQTLRADEMMVHFSSLAMHMDGDLVLRKARGLLHQFRLLPRISCTLSKLCELCGPGMWDSNHVPVVDCSGDHGDHSCPHGGQDPTIKTI